MLQQCHNLLCNTDHILNMTILRQTSAHQPFFFNNKAATEESTPPDTPQTTRRRIPFILFMIKTGSFLTSNNYFHIYLKTA